MRSAMAQAWRSAIAAVRISAAVSISTFALGTSTIALSLGPSACHSENDASANPIYKAFDPGVCQVALETAVTPALTDAQLLAALKTLINQIEQRQHAPTAVTSLTAPHHVIQLAAIYNGNKNVAVRQEVVHCLAELGALPHYAAMHDASVISVCLDALLDSDSEVRRWATKALATLVLDEKTSMQRFGKAILERLTGVFFRCSKEEATTREDALIALAGCVTLHHFSEAELSAAKVVSTLVRALSSSRAGQKEPRFACTALRELCKKSTAKGAIEADMMREHAAKAVSEQMLLAKNIWTRRAACKCMVELMQRPILLESSGLTLDMVNTAFQVAGKEDFMCARWQREAEKRSSAAPKKKWYE